MVNVKAGGCLKCNGDHSFRDKICPYHERSQLYTTPCKNCNVGGHSTASCLNPKTRNRVNRALQEMSMEEEEELEEYNEFMEGSIGGNSAI
jgi:hypothetical protein